MNKHEITANMQFKVTAFCTNQKPVCYFLLANGTNLQPCYYEVLVKLSLWQEVPLLNTLSWGEHPNSWLQKLSIN